MKLSVAVATYNEASNIVDCLKSIKEIAEEIVVVDGSSSDRTVELAQEFTKNIVITDNPPIFHINKQRAIDRCGGEWVLLLDADERVSKTLAQEIVKVINMTQSEIEKFQS